MNTDGAKNNLKFHLPAGELLERLQEYENLFSKISHNTKDSFHLCLPAGHQVIAMPNHH